MKGIWIVAAALICERSMKCSANVRLHIQTALSMVNSARNNGLQHNPWEIIVVSETKINDIHVSVTA